MINDFQYSGGLGKEKNAVKESVKLEKFLHIPKRSRSTTSTRSFRRIPDLA